MIFRYSMIQSYLTCPKDFYDRYILNKLDTEKKASLEFGTALHLGVRTCLEGENGIEAFNMYWDSIKDFPMTYYSDSWAGLKELGAHFLGNFKSRHIKKFSDFKQEIQMEMPFLMKRAYSNSTSDYGSETIAYVGDEPSGHILQGTADYIGMYEGKLTVADWKTSSQPYRKNKILLNPQLYIYAKLHQHTTGVLPEQVMYKVFNKKDGCINTIVNPLTQQYLDSILSSVEHIAGQILQLTSTKKVFHGAECYCPRL